ncbi:MAG: carbamoyltransferase C-terminal domain-containing protein, partial [Bryobacteraceae bacterium]
SIQAVTEEVVLLLARHARAETGATNLVMAGGVALNCVANGRLLREKIFDRIWIQPAAGDAGAALGAALLASHAYFGVSREAPAARDSQKGSYLGPAYSPAEVRAFLDRQGYAYERVEDPAARAARIAETLADGKIVGYFAGRMEFGPRSLGARSILGDPRRKETQSTMNLKIKYRESFRPFAPSVLVEDVAEYFNLDEESPYMLLVAPVRAERCLPMSSRGSGFSDADMLPLVNQARSDIPAVTHLDYSARIQTVHPDDKPDFYRVIREFKRLTGYGVVVNTSFNVRGEPIVCSPKDAYQCFMRTEMDLLVLEDCLVWKHSQKTFADTQAWEKIYELD